ncbi:hypothetical protein ACOMHN_040250 [Nucella lapillus]
MADTRGRQPSGKKVQWTRDVKDTPSSTRPTRPRHTRTRPNQHPSKLPRPTQPHSKSAVRRSVPRGARAGVAGSDTVSQPLNNTANNDLPENPRTEGDSSPDRPVEKKWEESHNPQKTSIEDEIIGKKDKKTENSPSVSTRKKEEKGENSPIISTRKKEEKSGNPENNSIQDKTVEKKEEKSENSPSVSTRKKEEKSENSPSVSTRKKEEKSENPGKTSSQDETIEKKDKESESPPRASALKTEASDDSPSDSWGRVNEDDHEEHLASLRRLASKSHFQRVDRILFDNAETQRRGSRLLRLSSDPKLVPPEPSPRVFHDLYLFSPAQSAGSSQEDKDDALLKSATESELAFDEDSMNSGSAEVRKTSGARSRDFPARADHQRFQSTGGRLQQEGSKPAEERRQREKRSPKRQQWKSASEGNLFKPSIETSARESPRTSDVTLKNTPPRQHQRYLQSTPDLSDPGVVHPPPDPRLLSPSRPENPQSHKERELWEHAPPPSYHPPPSFPPSFPTFTEQEEEATGVRRGEEGGVEEKDSVAPADPVISQTTANNHHHHPPATTSSTHPPGREGGNGPHGTNGAGRTGQSAPGDSSSAACDEPGGSAARGRRQATDATEPSAVPSPTPPLRVTDFTDPTPHGRRAAAQPRDVTPHPRGTDRTAEASRVELVAVSRVKCSGADTSGFVKSATHRQRATRQNVPESRYHSAVVGRTEYCIAEKGRSGRANTGPISHTDERRFNLAVPPNTLPRERRPAVSRDAKMSDSEDTDQRHRAARRQTPSSPLSTPDASNEESTSDPDELQLRSSLRELSAKIQLKKFQDDFSRTRSGKARPQQAGEVHHAPRRLLSRTHLQREDVPKEGRKPVFMQIDLKDAAPRSPSPLGHLHHHEDDDMHYHHGHLQEIPQPVQDRARPQPTGSHSYRGSRGLPEDQPILPSTARERAGGGLLPEHAPLIGARLHHFLETPRHTRRHRKSRHLHHHSHSGPGLPKTKVVPHLNPGTGQDKRAPHHSPGTVKGHSQRPHLQTRLSESSWKERFAPPVRPAMNDNDGSVGVSDDSDDDWDDVEIEEDYAGGDRYVFYLQTEEGAVIGPLKFDVEEIEMGLPTSSDDAGVAAASAGPDGMDAVCWLVFSKGVIVSVRL